LTKLRRTLRPDLIDEFEIRLADVFEGKRQLIVDNHMWFPGETWQGGFQIRPCAPCPAFRTVAPWTIISWARAL